MEYVAAAQTDAWSCSESFREADDTHIVAILRRIGSLACHTRETLLFVPDSSTEVVTGVHYLTSCLRIVHTILVGAGAVEILICDGHVVPTESARHRMNSQEGVGVLHGLRGRRSGGGEKGVCSHFDHSVESFSVEQNLKYQD